MGQVVIDGANLVCAFGTLPSNLKVTSQMTCLAAGKPVATIKDMAPGTNISKFGMCTSMFNPQVAAATAAALGTLQPQPCNFMPGGTWMCKSHCMMGGAPCLTSDGNLMCSIGAGSISVAMSGQTKIAAK